MVILVWIILAKTSYFVPRLGDYLFGTGSFLAEFLGDQTKGPDPFYSLALGPLVISTWLMVPSSLIHMPEYALDFSL